MTFLEVVFATAMLGIVVAVVMGAIGYILGRQRIEQQQLGATEMANRLMLQYLDNPFGMPDPTMPVVYGPDRFRWDMNKGSMRIVPAEPIRRGGGGSGGRENSMLEKSDLITIRVWLSEESGGSHDSNISVPHASINRLVYPILATRNPDSFNYLKNLDEYQRWMREKIGPGTGPTVGTMPGGGRGTQGRPVPGPASSPTGGGGR